MNKIEIIKLVKKIIEDYCETEGIEEKVNENTSLFGKESFLDSMGLVNIIVDIESKFLEEDIVISLTSESAMSRRNSPFKTVETIVNFINEQIEGNKT